MIVYMLLNEVEERVYVGQTNMTIDDRLRGHKHAVKTGSNAAIHVAMRKWPEDWMWTYVILQHCYDQAQLDAAEESWITLCSAASPGIGYNVSTTCRGGRDGTTIKRKSSLLYDMTPEERHQYFVDCGNRGAAAGSKGARKKADMSEEEREKYREWGRKGAAKSKAMLGH